MNAHARRRDRLREVMAGIGVGAVLVTDGVDVTYLSGYDGSNGALLVTGDDQVLATDGRYREQAARQCPGVELIITRDLVGQLLAAAATRGHSVVGFDPSGMSVGVWQSAKGAALEPVDLSLQNMRKVKDEAELDAVRQACRISVAALAELLPEITVGMTEIEIARRLELLMGLHGAQDRSFETIVAAGTNSAIPHHSPTQRPIAAGDLLKIDFGALFDGYHADCTRTFVVAADPQPWQEEIHAVVAAAQQAGISALAPGKPGREVDAVARQVVEDAGFGPQFGHGLGHGVGLEIHEAPLLAQTSENTVEARVPLTVEPGIYLPGRGGVRIEDTMIVEEAGVEILTQFARDLTRVG